VFDVCVSVLSHFISFCNLKVPEGSVESKYRLSTRDDNFANSTKRRVHAVWTEGGLSATKIGESFLPEHPPLETKSLDEWAAWFRCMNRPVSSESASPPAQIEKLRGLSAIDAMEVESGEGTVDGDSPDDFELAVEKDEGMKDLPCNELAEELPPV
jgi:hypothetical protein